jgi:UDP-N-acetylglucosamine--N-acetylmuramyl-(pentapeptide) pyrophosphoryl-undecaprenol N-acetylglucosamine transferase
MLARVVRAAAVTYEQTLPYFRGKGFVAGNPVRAGFFDQSPSAPRSALGVLIFGGSQGAHAINVACVEAAPRLAASGRPLDVTHQTGESDLALVREGYGRAGLAARVEPFLYEMHREMSAADLVVCRAGASTLAEVTAAGKPAILVPLPTATDDHQRQNARVLAKAGAAELIEQRELTGERLAAAMLALAADGERRRRMSQAARSLAKPDAAAVIAGRAFALAGV